MSRFMTLLQREWMQHHRGWLALILAPIVLGLGLLTVADKVEVGGLHDPVALMVGCTIAGTLGSLAIAWIALGFQASGLARRDVQDRSIEFWLSLPVGHAESIGATLLFHGLLMQCLALVLGFAGSQLLGLTLVAVTFGPTAWFDLPWAELLKADITGLLRLLLGVLLASVWLLPLWLPLMAASAWLKRWGLPALAVAVGGGHLLLSQAYGIDTIGRTLHDWWIQALYVITTLGEHSVDINGPDELTLAIAQVPGWMASGALAALRDMADPLIVPALLVSAASFALLVLRRRRSD